MPQKLYEATLWIYIETPDDISAECCIETLVAYSFDSSHTEVLDEWTKETNGAYAVCVQTQVEASSSEEARRTIHALLHNAMIEDRNNFNNAHSQLIRSYEITEPRELY